MSSFPGPPSELKPMVLNHLLPKLMNREQANIPEFFVSLGLAKVSWLRFV